MKPPGETKYAGPCVRKFPRDIERKVKKLKKECPEALLFLVMIFQDVDEVVLGLFVGSLWLPLAVGGFVAFERRRLGTECRFTLTPLGFAATQMEGER